MEPRLKTWIINGVLKISWCKYYTGRGQQQGLRGNMRVLVLMVKPCLIQPLYNKRFSVGRLFYDAESGRGIKSLCLSPVGGLTPISRNGGMGQYAALCESSNQLRMEPWAPCRGGYKTKLRLFSKVCRLDQGVYVWAKQLPRSSKPNAGKGCQACDRLETETKKGILGSTPLGGLLWALKEWEG